MAYFIVIYSKYAIVLFQLLFLICSVYGLGKKEAGQAKKAAVWQSVFLFLMQFCAYLTIVIRTQRMEYLIFYLFLQILTLALPLLAYFLYPGINRLVLNEMSMLLSAGMIVLVRLDLKKAAKQLAIAMVSYGLLLAVPWLFKRLRTFLRDLGWVYCIAGTLALAVVLILGQVTHGSKLSWSIAGITFQPSEFVKILYVFFIASLLADGAELKKVLLAGFGAGIQVIVLVLSKDLGSALILFAVYVLMITVAAHQPLYLAGGLFAGAGASLIAWKLFSHVQVRVQAWKDPWSVIDSQGYQITQSLFAIGRGGLFGHAAGHPLCGNGLYFCGAHRGNGAFIRHRDPSYGSASVSVGHAPCGRACRRLLPESCGGLWDAVYIPDVSDGGRRHEIYPADRGDAALYQLRRQQRDVDDPDICSAGGRLADAL